MDNSKFLFFQLCFVLAISIFGTYLLLLMFQYFRQILGWLAFNLIYGALIALSNFVGTISTLSFKYNSPIKYYSPKEVELNWHFWVKDATVLHELFEQPSIFDLVKMKVENYAEFLDLIRLTSQPTATKQTKKFAEYMAANFGKDYKTLYHFMRMYFDYETENITKDLSEKVKLPNQLWKDGKGDCEDFGLFVSGVLSNWGINHNLNIAVFDNKAHLFVSTEGGTIIDPCCRKFDKKIFGKEPAWQTSVVILADNVNDLGKCE